MSACRPPAELQQRHPQVDSGRPSAWRLQALTAAVFLPDDGSAEVYVDLAYLPSGPAASTVDAEFFRRLRSLHYIISGDDEAKAAAMSSILDALLEGKSSWPEVQVSKSR